MSPDMEERAIEHIEPGISITVEGISIVTRHDLNVTVLTERERITLTQEQFLTLLRWGYRIVHRDWP